MSRSLNKVTLIGNLGKDPEMRSTTNGSRVANFSLATSRTWNDASGTKQEKTEWHRCVVWNTKNSQLADIAVAPEGRRRGVGGMLLDRVIAESSARRLRALYLEVRESNSAARALYASRDFELVGARRGYYRRPTEDALVLKREFDDV